jgi:carboxypeptidase family protein
MHWKTDRITPLLGAIAVACATSTAACGDTPTAPEPARTTNSLSGTVSDVCGLVQLHGAVVTHMATSRSVTTDRRGGYLISELPSGSAIITVALDGYESVTKSVDVFGVTRLDLRLVPVRRREPLPLASLSGVVYEKTAADSNTHISSKTDEAGRYRLVFEGSECSLFDGSVTLYVAKEGYQTMGWEMGVSGDTHFDIEIMRR